MSSENTPDLFQKAFETTVISTHPSHYSTFFPLSSPNVLELMKTHGWIEVFWSLTPCLSWAWIYSSCPCLYKETVKSITFSCNLPLCCKVKPAKGMWNIARSCQTPASGFRFQCGSPVLNTEIKHLKDQRCSDWSVCLSSWKEQLYVLILFNNTTPAYKWEQDCGLQAQTLAWVN